MSAFKQFPNIVLCKEDSIENMQAEQHNSAEAKKQKCPCSSKRPPKICSSKRPPKIGDLKRSKSTSNPTQRIDAEETTRTVVDKTASPLATGHWEGFVENY